MISTSSSASIKLAYETASSAFDMAADDRRFEEKRPKGNQSRLCSSKKELPDVDFLRDIQDGTGIRMNHYLLLPYDYLRGKFIPLCVLGIVWLGSRQNSDSGLIISSRSVSCEHDMTDFSGAEINRKGLILLLFMLDKEDYSLCE